MAEEKEEGKVVGNYMLTQTLGQGSFGKVKLGINMRTREQVAVKLVDKGSIADVDDVERVYRETFILTTLKHRNIIRLYEVMDTPDTLCVAMEYADGGELFDYVRKQHRLNELQSCQLFHEIVSGVEYCHRNKIIHRDLKLENILLDRMGTVKIADFGLSNSIKFGQKMNTNCGTPAYTCPEQITGRKYVGSAADIWSMGIILFAMVTGYLPFEAQGVPEVFEKITNRQFKFPAFLSEECCDLIDRMLTLDPDQRATISEIRSHKWYLMDLNQELVERLEAMQPVTEEQIAEERALCQQVGEQADPEARPLSSHLAAIAGLDRTPSPSGSRARDSRLEKGSLRSRAHTRTATGRDLPRGHTHSATASGLPRSASPAGSKRTRHRTLSVSVQEPQPRYMAPRHGRTPSNGGRSPKSSDLSTHEGGQRHSPMRADKTRASTRLRKSPRSGHHQTLSMSHLAPLGSAAGAPTPTHRKGHDRATSVFLPPINQRSPRKHEGGSPSYDRVRSSPTSGRKSVGGERPRSKRGSHSPRFMEETISSRQRVE